MVVVTSEHGFDAACAAEVKLHPSEADIWRRRRDSLKVMRTQGNDQEKRLLTVESTLKDLLSRPF